jgi:hypothetical protein
VEPKCQNKWELIYNKKVMWEVLWRNRNLLSCKQQIIQFQWNCIHFIVYTESRLQRMGKSNGLCYFCKNNTESLQHLFFQYLRIKPIIEDLNTMIIA